MKFLKWFGFALACMPLLAAAAEVSSNAKVIALSGSVVLTGPDGKVLSSAVGTELPEGSSVTTSAGGQATVQLFNETVTIVQPNSNVTIETRKTVSESDGLKEETMLDLKAGGVVNSLDPAKKQISRFKVRTPKGVAAARGTVFAVKITTDGNSTVTTMHGTVTFVTDQGSFTVGIGQVSSGNGVLSVADAVAANPGLANDILQATADVAAQVGAGTITSSADSPNLTTEILAAMVSVAVQASPGNAASIVHDMIVAAGGTLTSAQVNQITLAATKAVSDPQIISAITQAANNASKEAGVKAGGSTNVILPPLDQTQIKVSPSGS